MSLLWQEIDRVQLTEERAWRSGELAELCALRDDDATQLASAEAVLDTGDVPLVAGERLAEAAASIGVDALVLAG